MAKEKSILDILTEAIAAKKTTKIIYKGGSQPGAVRKILPLKIDGNKLIADCLSSEKQNQVFEIDKVFYAGGLAQSYNTTLDLPLVKCKICGKKFHGESWRTYCSDCYREKKLAEENNGYEEIEEDEEYENNEDTKTRRQILKEAIGTGEAIKVIYYGGSTPGEERELVIRKILKNGYVKCFCLRDNIEKTYVINKMEIDGMNGDDFVDRGDTKVEKEATILHGILAIIIIALFIFTIVCFFRDEWIRFFISIFFLAVIFGIFNGIPMKVKSAKIKEPAAEPPKDTSLQCPVEIKEPKETEPAEPAEPTEPAEIKSPENLKWYKSKLKPKEIALVALLVLFAPIIIPCIIISISFLIDGKIGEFIGVTILATPFVFASYKIIKRLRK